jgi:hypothetical protein
MRVGTERTRRRKDSIRPIIVRPHADHREHTSLSDVCDWNAHLSHRWRNYHSLGTADSAIRDPVARAASNDCAVESVPAAGLQRIVSLRAAFVWGSLVFHGRNVLLGIVGR